MLANCNTAIVSSRLEGDVVNPGGAMTGGTVNKQTSLIISRTRELEEVTANWRDVEKKRLSSNSASSEKKRHCASTRTALTSGSILMRYAYRCKKKKAHGRN
ncbi:MAG: hypothetical protein KatS3mg080_0182 [Anoxybacillus sp.]|nr:MAG: hypothetical protein KatS3mg080_0182 [Anoxybacillus sp.]